MARTVGTNANNSLNGFLVGTDDLVPANVANLLTGSPGPGIGIRTEIPMVNQVLQTGIPRNLINGAYTQQGTLLIPGRGVLVLRPGDFIGVDLNTGWPILLSADCAANGTWTHT
jgi:hypothetical protein